jgi:hypothetical protein
VVADKGYHSGASLAALREMGVRSYVSDRYGVGSSPCETAGVRDHSPLLGSEGQVWQFAT